ncbi:hypothetical protein FRC19_003990 [Serendipita sp. 401]|nr:hypothetical protein FRC18_011447 [Serendipita sp. 400]KAG8823409.1 hypothetical protein FRC19_003990 [Serendipita sp. 401]
MASASRHRRAGARGRQTKVIVRRRARHRHIESLKIAMKDRRGTTYSLERRLEDSFLPPASSFLLISRYIYLEDESQADEMPYIRLFAVVRDHYGRRNASLWTALSYIIPYQSFISSRKTQQQERGPDTARSEQTALQSGVEGH